MADELLGATITVDGRIPSIRTPLNLGGGFAPDSIFTTFAVAPVTDLVRQLGSA